MLFGFGMAVAHEVSSLIQPTSSSDIGAPCAAKMTGIRPPAGFHLLSVRVAMLRI